MLNEYLLVWEDIAEGGHNLRGQEVEDEAEGDGYRQSWQGAPEWVNEIN